MLVIISVSVLHRMRKVIAMHAEQPKLHSGLRVWHRII